MSTACTYGFLWSYPGFPFGPFPYTAGVDLSGSGLTLTVRDEDGAALLTLTSAAGGGITITDAPGGAATIAGSAAQASLVPVGQHDADVVLVDAGGFPLLDGPLTRLRWMSYFTPGGTATIPPPGPG